MDCELFVRDPPARPLCRDPDNVTVAFVMDRDSVFFRLTECDLESVFVADCMFDCEAAVTVGRLEKEAVIVGRLRVIEAVPDHEEDISLVNVGRESDIDRETLLEDVRSLVGDEDLLRCFENVQLMDSVSDIDDDVVIVASEDVDGLPVLCIEVVADGEIS